MAVRDVTDRDVTPPTTRPLAAGSDHTLTSGPYTAAIASVGASLRSLRHAGEDLVVGYDADQVRPLFRGAILAPWPNRVADGRYTDDLGEHQLALTEPDRGHALHGLLAWHDFQPVEQTADEVVLRGEVVPQQGYPHRVRVDVRYRLDTDGLSTEVIATNRGSTRAPWGTGPHPYLRAGTGTVDDWTLRLPAAEVLEVTPDRLVPTRTSPVGDVDSGRFDFRQPRRIGDVFIDHAFTGLVRDDVGWTQVELTAPDGRGVSIGWDTSCAWVQIHTADRPSPAENRIGLAVEPMTCAPDAYNNGWGLAHLDPDQTTRAGWAITAVGR